MHRGGAVMTPPTPAHLTSSLWTTLPPGEYALIVKGLYLNCVGLLLPAVCPTALPHTTLLHSNHRLYVEREINIILCLMICFSVVFIPIFEYSIYHIKSTFLIGHKRV